MTWRHAPYSWSVGDGSICEDVPDIDGYICGCATPRPDPLVDLLASGGLEALGMTVEDLPDVDGVSSVTFCLCGHRITEVPA